ncbi:OLC1v1010601C1 [Oldenlandia corymbosa var. corymbosa]|uniref:OLC1v1010601C1 n=1 Tax=Oldenlandia corymbosa var. corymbosa TaxID=529605 RepID=A0AAV1DTD6_OLDCO|nr:OLC1v1010601C1 [Oldenlandia corymbosa var. corymbosa]
MMTEQKEEMMQKSSSNLAPIQKVKFLCSFGGKIQPLPNWNRLVYSGGDSKILIADRNIKLGELIGRIVSVCRITWGSVTVKYKLPGKDLSVLVPLTDDHDLENLMQEYERLHRDRSPAAPASIRLIIEVSAPIWLNSGPGSGLNPDYLFGFDKESDYSKLVHDDLELEHWKIPRAGDCQPISTPPESDQQIGGYKCTAGDGDVAQSQKRDGPDDDNGGVSAAMPPQQQVIYWIPGTLALPTTPRMGFGRPANSCSYCWSEAAPVYVLVPSTTTVSRLRLA